METIETNKMVQASIVGVSVRDRFWRRLHTHIYILYIDCVPIKMSR